MKGIAALHAADLPVVDEWTDVNFEFEVAYPRASTMAGNQVWQLFMSDHDQEALARSYGIAKPSRSLGVIARGCVPPVIAPHLRAMREHRKRLLGR
jgi:hypothetical protein